MLPLIAGDLRYLRWQVVLLRLHQLQVLLAPYSGNFILQCLRLTLEIRHNDSATRALNYLVPIGSFDIGNEQIKATGGLECIRAAFLLEYAGPSIYRKQVSV